MNRQQPHITVVKSGWLTTVQDLGRYGSQQYGVPVAGVMDVFSAIVANRLVGNPDRAALLELTLKGPELQCERDVVMAITGADLSLTINGRRAPLWESIQIMRGDRLGFGEPRAGARAYLALAGGIDVPIVLGSRSTHCASETGGFQGRALKPGDRLLCGGPALKSLAGLIGRKFPDQLIPRYGRAVSLRVIQGTQSEYFLDQSLAMLIESTYTVSPQSNRMGYRLTGPKIARKGSAPFVSEGTATGALQVPSDEQPILLMADRQPTGGYPTIAVVITADLPLAAQIAPGDRVRFVLSTLADAQALLRRQHAQLDAALPPWSDPSQSVDHTTVQTV